MRARRCSSPLSLAGGGPRLRRALHVGMPGRYFSPPTPARRRRRHRDLAQLELGGARRPGAAVGPGDEVTRTFAEPGRVPYVCVLHPSMDGVVDVVPVRAERAGRGGAAARRSCSTGARPAGTTAVTIERDGAPVTTVAPGPDGTFRYSAPAEASGVLAGGHRRRAPARTSRCGWSTACPSPSGPGSASGSRRSRSRRRPAKPGATVVPPALVARALPLAAGADRDARRRRADDADAREPRPAPRAGRAAPGRARSARRCSRGAGALLRLTAGGGRSTGLLMLHLALELVQRAAEVVADGRARRSARPASRAGLTRPRRS